MIQGFTKKVHNYKNNIIYTKVKNRVFFIYRLKFIKLGESSKKKRIKPTPTSMIKKNNQSRIVENINFWENVFMFHLDTRISEYFINVINFIN